MKRPILAITMGDPVGIGPEITLKALRHDWVLERSKPLVIAHKVVIDRAIDYLGYHDMEVEVVKEPSEGSYAKGKVTVLDLGDLDFDAIPKGKPSAEGGRASFQSIEKAIELALQDKVDAVVTNPIHKEAINMAGYHYSGHTEIFADKTGAKSYAMMLAVGDFRVVHVNTHVSMREAIERIKKDRVLEVIKLTHDALIDLGISEPRIAVAALNPHAGEGGLFGREEIEEIEPAIKEAQDLGINATGPYPADTIFSKAYGGAFDAVVVMYHDQGHIPVKLIGFKWDQSRREWSEVRGINVTLGLPIIRTSVDHGVAFGKAWKKRTADETSLLDAIDYAIKLAISRISKKSGG